MHVLTVIDHPNPSSFTHAVAARFREGAEAGGHTVEVADLHAEGFNPAWQMGDIEARDVTACRSIGDSAGGRPRPHGRPRSLQEAAPSKEIKCRVPMVRTPVTRARARRQSRNRSRR